MRSVLFFALFLVISFAIGGLSGGVYAQAPGPNSAKSVEFKVEVVEQPDCPLKLLLEAQSPNRSSLGLKLHNTGDKPIQGYVLIVDDGFGKQIQATVRPVKMIEADKAVFENPNIFKPGKLTFSVDYIEFSDGSTWGSDEFKRSKYIKDYLTGRDLAVSRLKEMLGGTIPEDFQKLLDTFGSYGVGEPAIVKRRDSPNRHLLAGYRSVIDMLRHAKNRTEDAQDLARKLELMENTLS